MDELEALVEGRRTGDAADIETVVARVLPGFAHVGAEARLDDRI